MRKQKTSKGFRIKQARPDDPIYSRNQIHFLPQSSKYPIDPITLSAINPQGQAILDLFRQFEGPGSLDPIQEYMILKGLPLTRETYLDLRFPGGLPADWSDEDEETLPGVIRDDFGSETGEGD